MNIKQTVTFQRQLKKLAKKHYPVRLLAPCIDAILAQDTFILRRIKDHALKGNWQGYREFHPGRYTSKIQSDAWIVVYRLEAEALILTLVATGNHAILD